MFIDGGGRTLERSNPSYWVDVLDRPAATFFFFKVEDGASLCLYNLNLKHGEVCMSIQAALHVQHIFVLQHCVSKKHERKLPH